MSDLPEGAHRALERARAERLSFSVRLLRAADGRLVAVLGEAHMKLAKAAAIGKEVVGQFELRGVETFQRKQVVGGRALGVVITAPRTLLRLLSFGAVRGSTITDAKQLPSGFTVDLERTKHVPFGLHVTSLYMTAFFAVAFPRAADAPAGAHRSPSGRSDRVPGRSLPGCTCSLLIPGIVLSSRHSWSWR